MSRTLRNYQIVLDLPCLTHLFNVSSTAASAPTVPQSIFGHWGFLYLRCSTGNCQVCTTSTRPASKLPMVSVVINFLWPWPRSTGEGEWDILPLWSKSYICLCISVLCLSTQIGSISKKSSKLRKYGKIWQMRQMLFFKNIETHTWANIDGKPRQFTFRWWSDNRWFLLFFSKSYLDSFHCLQ